MVGRKDLPAVLLHDTVGDGQAEARTLADFLRRVERLENPRQRFLRNPVTRVAHGGDDAIARQRGGALDAPGTARRAYSLLGVHQDVEKYLMEQQRIALHARQLLSIVSH